MAHLVGAVLIVMAVIAITFLPFIPGGHDPLAVPLATMAWASGRAGLVLVPIGLLWARRNTRPGWLIHLTVGACAFIALVMITMAFAASSSVLLATATAVTAGFLIVRLARRLRSVTAVPAPRVRSAILTLAPIVVVGAQSMLIDPVTTRARNRAITNSAPFIAEIERYRERHGAYPVSLFSIWGDYKPSIVGIDRYHYEPSGDAYNVIFKEPSLDFGMRRFVVYNPRDTQRLTLHEHDRLLLDEAGLDADNAGHTLIQPLQQPHWTIFLFLS